MFVIPGYQIITQIYEGANSSVYRGLRNHDNSAVILKILKQDCPTPQQLTRYKQEYEITKNLNFAGIVKANSLENYLRNLVIIFDDFGGNSLKILMNSRKFTLIEFLEISIKITESLSYIHTADIIHKDINPSNIVFNPELDQLKIIDFGISTVLSRETPTIKNPNVLEGTLAYISPEQTGRMSRSLDYRTDFYSLGASLYELLTYQLPFDTTDAMELVHCHIAKQPVPPHELNPEIPLPVSDIIMKLLAKTAEERYQSAWGIKADLAKCLEQLKSWGKVTNFTLCSQDISDRLQISQKLYGREQQIETLITVFERVSWGKAEMMLVSGYSGIGKTALVQVLYQPITQQRGYFISGKFDQFQRSVPYAAVVKAFSDLMHQLLTETHTQLNRWREKILSALGTNAQVIIAVIPEVELIIGKQPQVTELPPLEAQNRLRLVLKNFIKVFAKREHPLVIFLDDLQWADTASLKLMQLLMSDVDSQHLLLIGAYRNNEVNATHPLILVLNEIRKARAIVNQIIVTPLLLDDVIKLIADSLKCKLIEVKPLAELVLNKTCGNPFFINEFLKSLHAEELLYFDTSQGGWRWNLEQIQARGITDNVVTLMAKKIQSMNLVTQQALQHSACIGNQFDLNTLAIVLEKTQKVTAVLLHQAISAGLILPLGDAYKMVELDVPIPTDRLEVKYKFVHDRIQQAAYSLIPQEQKKQTHLKIGQLLLKNTPLVEQEANIFAIVNQLNVGSELLVESEKYDFAALNLMAGMKAKSAAAYEPALKYLHTGIGLLAADSWKNKYDLTLALYVEAAEAAYLCANLKQMEQLALIVLERANTRLDKVKIYEVKIQAYIAQNQALAAIRTSIQVLELLDVKLPKTPSKLNILIGLLNTKSALARKRIPELVDLPQMTDPTKLAALRILSSIASAAFVADPQLFAISVFKQVNLSVKYGNAPLSAFAYSTYGSILCGVARDINSGYQFGQLALMLLERLDAKEIKAKTFIGFNTLVRHWQEHISATLAPLCEGYQSGLDTGDLEYAAISAHTYCFHSYFIGKELVALEQEIASYSEAIAQLGQKTFFNYNEIYRQAVLNLLGQSENPCQLDGEAYNEKMLQQHQQVNDKTAIAKFYLQKTTLCYLFQNFEQAIASADQGEKYLDGATTLVVFGVFHLYDSLARLAVYNSVNKPAQQRLLLKVVANQKKLRKWSNHAPMNYLHKFHLVEAERHRVLGHVAKAVDLYDQAIELAKEHKYINEEALANELAGKFYLDRGKTTIAQAYMLNARYCYLSWGAVRKVDDLNEHYPQLLSSTSEISTIETISTKASTIEGGEALDLKTVLKASQAISSEIMLDKLLEKLMKIVIENAGAQKGYLILSKQQKLYIEAVGTVETTTEIIRQSVLIDKTNIPITLISYVERTQETVVFDAKKENRFSHDPYIYY